MIGRPTSYYYGKLGHFQKNFDTIGSTNGERKVLNQKKEINKATSAIATSEEELLFITVHNDVNLGGEGERERERGKGKRNSIK